MTNNRQILYAIHGAGNIAGKDDIEMLDLSQSELKWTTLQVKINPFQKFDGQENFKGKFGWGMKRVPSHFRFQLTF